MSVKTNPERKAHQRMMSLAKTKVFDELHSRSNCTRDIYGLKVDYGPLIPILIYDELCKGQADSHMLDDYPYFGQATTLEDSFVMMRSGQSVLCMYPESELKISQGLNVTNEKRIIGDLYGVPLDVLFWLDRSYNNGEFYHRIETPVTLHQVLGGSIPLPRVQLYVADYKYWSRQVKKPVDRLTLVTPSLSEHTTERVYQAFPPKVKLPLPAFGRDALMEAPYGMSYDPDDQTLFAREHGWE
jgi:hypothetical protein